MRPLLAGGRKLSWRERRASLKDACVVFANLRNIPEGLSTEIDKWRAEAKDCLDKFGSNEEGRGAKTRPRNNASNPQEGSNTGNPENSTSKKSRFQSKERPRT